MTGPEALLRCSLESLELTALMAARQAVWACGAAEGLLSEDVPPEVAEVISRVRALLGEVAAVAEHRMSREVSQ